MPKLLKKEKAEAIIFDPPRREIDEKPLRSVVKNKIKKIIYISCNSTIFKRDTKFLIENRYRLEKVPAVDMFLHTNHVEVVRVMIKITSIK